MADINPNPGNFSGLAAVAGRNTGGLGLKVPGSGLLEWKKLANQKNQAVAGRLTNFGKGLLGQDEQNQEMDLKERAMALQEGRAGDQAGLAERGMALQERGQEHNIAKEEQRAEMSGLIKQEETKIHEMGSFAAQARISMEDVPDPAEASALQQEIVSESVSNGYVTKEEGEQLSRLPVSRFKSALDFKIMQLGKVSEYQKMRPKQTKGKGGKSGDVTIRRPDGTVVQISEPTATVKTQSQKDITTAGDNIKELTDMYQNAPDEFFGAQALGQNATMAREWAAGVPGLSGIDASPEQKQQLEKYSGFIGQSEMNAMTVIKQLSGVQYSDKQLEFLRSILPSIGAGTTKSQFNGRAKNLLRFFDDVKESREQLLKNGYDLGSPEYEEKMLSSMKGTSGVSATRQHYKDKGWSDSDITAALKARGVE